MPDLLMYSMAEHRSIWEPILDLVEPSAIMEIGSEAAHLTALIAERSESAGCRYVVVEPHPGDALRALAGTTTVLEIVEGYSPQALAELAACDVYFLDGDHNYATVVGECRAIASTARAAGTTPVLLFHDVGWPCARRDLYYEPERLKPADRQEYSYEFGVLPGRTQAGPGGFSGEGEFAFAVSEGGPRNGVLTAIEDFLAEDGDWVFVTVPAVFGLGVMYPVAAPFAAELGALLKPYVDQPLIAALERNRLDNYLRVLELQTVLAQVQSQQSDSDEVLARTQAELAELTARVPLLEAKLTALANELLATKIARESARPQPPRTDFGGRRSYRALAVAEKALRKVRPGYVPMTDLMADR